MFQLAKSTDTLRQFCVASLKKCCWFKEDGTWKKQRTNTMPPRTGPWQYTTLPAHALLRCGMGDCLADHRSVFLCCTLQKRPKWKIITITQVMCSFKRSANLNFFKCRSVILWMALKYFNDVSNLVSCFWHYYYWSLIDWMIHSLKSPIPNWCIQSMSFKMKFRLITVDLVLLDLI